MAEPVTNLLARSKYSVPYRTLSFANPPQPVAQEVGATDYGTPIRKLNFNTTVPETDNGTITTGTPSSLKDIFQTTFMNPERLYQSMRATAVPATRQIGSSLGALTYSLTGGKYGSREKGADIAEYLMGRPLRGALDIPTNVWSAIQLPFKETVGRVPLIGSLVGGRPESSYLLKTLAGNRPKDAYEATNPNQVLAEDLGRAALGQILAAPLAGGVGLAGMAKAAVGRAIPGTLMGTAFSAIPLVQEAVKTGKLPDKDTILNQLKQGAISGAENSWMLAFTDLATDKILASKIAQSLTGGKSALLQSGLTQQAMQPLVQASKAGAPLAIKAPLFARGAGIFLARALAEVPVENTVWTYLGKLKTDDKTNFFKSWVNNLPSTTVGNIAYAGLNTATKGAVPFLFNKGDIDAGIQALKDTASQLVTDPKYQEGFARLDLGLTKESTVPNRYEIKPSGKSGVLDVIDNQTGNTVKTYQPSESDKALNYINNLNAKESTKQIRKPGKALVEQAPVTATEQATAVPESVVSMVGKEVTVDGQPLGKIVDDSDPSLYQVQTPEGGIRQIGKKAAGMEIAGVTPPTPVPAPVPEPVKPVEAVTPVIPPNLQTLASEARKYATVDEFEKAMYKPDTPSNINTALDVLAYNKDFKSLEDFYNQAKATPLPEVQAVPVEDKTSLYQLREKLVAKQTELADKGLTYKDKQYEDVSRQIYQLEKRIYEGGGKQNGEAPPEAPPIPQPEKGESSEDYVKRSIRRQLDYLTEDERKHFDEVIVPQLAPIMDKYMGKGKWTQDDLLEFAAKKVIVNTKLQSDPQMQKAMVDMIVAGKAFAQKYGQSFETGEGLSKDGIDAYLKFAQAKSFFGRALKAADITVDPATKLFTDSLEAKMLTEIASTPGIDLETVAKEAKGVDFDNPKEATAFYRKYIKPSWFEIWNQYRYVNLLSNPLTHVTNALGNTVQMGVMKPLTMTASGIIDPIYSRLTGSDQTHYLNEVPSYFQGVASSLGQASEDFLKAMRGEEFMMQPELRYLTTGGQAPETDVLGIGKGLSEFGEKAGFIPRLMNASDVFFRDLIAGGEMEALRTAYANKGQIPEIDLSNKAEADALYWLYRQGLDPTGEKTGQPLGLRGLDKLTGAIMSARSRVPLVNIFIPFVQTPANIVKQGIEFSPIGSLDTMVTQALSKMNPNIMPVTDPVQQYAKSLVGSLITAAALSIISKTDATAEAPTNPEERKRWFASGRKEWSILLPTPWGKQWVGMQRLGTAAYPIALAELFYDRAYKNRNRLTRTGVQGTFDTAMDALYGLVPYFARQTYVQGISDLMGLVSSNGSPFEDVISRAASQPMRQAIPFTAFLSAISRVVDPIYRKPSGGTIQRTYERVATGIPFLSKTLSPYTDPLGSPSTRAPLLINFFDSLISPIQFSPSVTGYFEMLFLTKNAQSELNTLKKAVQDGEMTPELAAQKAEALIEQFQNETNGLNANLPENYNLNPVLPPTVEPEKNWIQTMFGGGEEATPTVAPTTIPTTIPATESATTTRKYNVPYRKLNF
jgi:hypothetical protein